MSKRRPNGDGMVRKRPDGRWEARIIVGHKEDGKPIYKSVFGRTQSEAMTKFYKLLETYRGVELNEDCLVNLNEWLDRWLCYQKDVVRPQTLNKYIFYADAYIRPYLGDKKNLSDPHAGHATALCKIAERRARHREQDQRKITLGQYGQSSAYDDAQVL